MEGLATYRSNGKADASVASFRERLVLREAVVRQAWGGARASRERASYENGE